MSRLIYGRHPVMEALRRRGSEVKGLFISQRAQLERLQTDGAARGIPVQQSTDQELELLCSSTSHQGVVAVVGDYPYKDLENILEETDVPALLVVLDSVTDPQNLGAIIRSALVLGATGLVIPRDRAAPITPVVVRVSAGASEHLPCAQVTNLARALAQLKEAGLWVAGAVEQGGDPPEQLDLRGPSAIVLGNEQKGIRPLVLRGCDHRITIPSRSGIAALNVAAAATVLLYESARQRRSV